MARKSFLEKSKLVSSGGRGNLGSVTDAEEWCPEEEKRGGDSK